MMISTVEDKSDTEIYVVCVCVSMCVLVCSACACEYEITDDSVCTGVSENHPPEESGQQHRCGSAGQGGGGQMQADSPIQVGRSATPYWLPFISERGWER